MNVLIGLLGTLLFVVSFLANADSNIVVRFINGIWIHEKCDDRKSCAEKNTEVLRNVLQKRFGKDLNVQLSYNKHESKKKDFFEAVIQASKSDHGLKKLSDFFRGDISPELYDRFLKEKERRYSAELWEHAFKQKMFAEILQEQANSPFGIAKSTPIVASRSRGTSIPKSLKRLVDDFAVEFFISAVSHIPNYENSA